MEAIKTRIYLRQYDYNWFSFSENLLSLSYQIQSDPILCLESHVNVPNKAITYVCIHVCVHVFSRCPTCCETTF